jgi:P4 family phage/plasmid primase-like protien
VQPAGVEEQQTMSNVIEPTNESNTNPENRRSTELIGFRFDQSEFVEVQVAQLQSLEFLEELIGRLSSTRSLRLRGWENLVAFPSESRHWFLSTIATSGVQVIVSGDRADNSDRAPFEATLNLRAYFHALPDVGRWRAFAVEVAAIFLPDSREDAIARIDRAHRDAGGAALNRRDLAREINRFTLSATRQTDTSPAAVADAFLAALQEEHQRSALGNAEPPNAESPEHDAPPLRFFQEDFFEHHGNHFRRIPQSQLRARVVEHMRMTAPHYSEGTIATVMSTLKGRVLINDWETSPPFYLRDDGIPERRRLVSFSNGQIDVDELLRTGQPRLLSYDARWFSTVALPFAFNPAATCDRWLQILHEVLTSRQCEDNRMEVLQEYVGWLLVHGDLQFEKFMIMCGRGRNGKSTILRIITKLLGEDNVSQVPLDAFASEFRIHAMADKLANIVGDMGYIDKAHEGLLKQLVTGERIQVNRKHKEPISMRPTAKLLFACNELPQINDKSDGIWRRLIIMPFQYQIPQVSVDTGLYERLCEELPGILNWAIEGLVRLYRQGEFTRCEVCDAIANEHRYNSDPLRQFLDECCHRGDGISVLSKHLYDAYTRYCRDGNRKPRGHAEIGKQLREFGIEKEREGAQRDEGCRPYIYRGIGLNPDILSAVLRH